MKKEKSRAGRNRSLLILWVVLAAVMATAITITSVSILTSQIRKDRELTVQGAAKLAANAVDPKLVDGWLQNGKDKPYAETFEMLKDILNNTPNLKYLYIYQIRDDGCHVVFDTDPEEPGNLGDLQEFDETFMPYVPKLLAGEKIDMIESNDSFGWLLSDYEPIYNTQGKCVAYVGADVSMNEISTYARHLVLIIVLIAAVFLVACIIIGLKLSIDKHKADELDILKEQQQRDKQLIREIIESFAKVIDMKDSYTQGHSFRVAKYTQMLARELGYDEETVEQYYNIALMHDIGKVSIPDQVLNKPGKLTDEEFAVIKSHTSRGHDVLNSISLMPELVVGAE